MGRGGGGKGRLGVFQKTSSLGNPVTPNVEWRMHLSTDCLKVICISSVFVFVFLFVSVLCSDDVEWRMHLSTDCMKVKARHSPLVTLSIQKKLSISVLQFWDEEWPNLSIFVKSVFKQHLLNFATAWTMYMVLLWKGDDYDTLKSHSVSLEGSPILNSTQWLLVFHSMKFPNCISTVFVFVYPLYLYLYIHCICICISIVFIFVFVLCSLVWKSPL